MPSPSPPQPPLYLGLDLSTQQLKAVIVDGDLATIARATVDFDADLGARHGVHKGVVRPAPDEVAAPVALWLDALDLVLARLPRPAVARVVAVAGAAQQHGYVCWNARAAQCLARLDAERPLAEQLAPALAVDLAPNWQDQSTAAECAAFDAALGGREHLANVTGSGAHQRFTGPQMMRFARRRPDAYAATARISLVSSWLASVLRGAITPLDRSDVCGMNLWDVAADRWSDALLALAAGGSPAAGADLRAKLGEPGADAGADLGAVAPYFVARHGFGAGCRVVPCTGDNPATMLAVPLRPLDAIVSLGTSTTFLMSTPVYRPAPDVHFFNHPTTPGLYMFMLCYKNGGLAREAVRDDLPPADWPAFDRAVLAAPPLDMAEPDARAKLGLYFPLRETVPGLGPGVWRFTATADGSGLAPADAVWPRATDARVMTESQALSVRLRARALVAPPRPGLPAQPRRIYLVGGGALSPAITRVLGDVLGGADGVYRLSDAAAACARGAAYKALWACERASGQTFDDLIAARWSDDGAVEKVGDGYRESVFDTYGRVLGAFEEMEQRLLAEDAAT